MAKNAEYQISSSVNDGILEIILTGEVTESTVEKWSNEVIAIIKAKGVANVLQDLGKRRVLPETFCSLIIENGVYQTLDENLGLDFFFKESKNKFNN